MNVDVIEYVKEFEKIQRNWDRIYRSDPESHAFLSWAWLHEYLSCHERWFILAWKRRPSGRYYDAFLPLEVATHQDEHTGLFRDEILMVGNHGTGRTGFLCAPGVEFEAADAFAGVIATENWASIRFDDCGAGSGRLDRLLGAFPEGTFMRAEAPETHESFTACERRIPGVLVRTSTGRNLRDSLNRRSIDLVFKRATALHAQGRLDCAEAGYRQVIRTVPGHVEARCRLASLCNDKGEHAEAEYLYRTLLSAVPEADAVLHCLGDTQIARARYREASKTFEDLLTRHPHRGILRYKLAVALLAAGRKGAAIATLESFDEVASDDADHIRCRLRAREILPRLKAVARIEEEGQAPLEPLAFAPADDPLGDPQAVRPGAARFMTAAPLLLTPSLPSGASAHLLGGASMHSWKSSKLKH